MTEQALVGDTVDGSTLVCSGDGYFTKFVPWLEEILEDARHLGLDGWGTDETKFIESLGIIIDEEDWDGEMPGQSGTFMQGWDSGSPETTQAIARTRFAEMAHKLKVDTTANEETLLYIRTPTQTSISKTLDHYLAANSWTLEDFIDHYDPEICEIETAIGLVTVLWCSAKFAISLK